MVTGMELTPGHNSLEVEFRALHFDIGEGLRYQYWLEGADTDWSKPSDAPDGALCQPCCGKLPFRGSQHHRVGPNQQRGRRL